MNRTQAALIAALTALLSFAGGYFFYAHTMARYDAVSSVCVAMQEAVRLQMLAPEQVRQLGMVTGSTLKRDHRAVADKLSISDHSAREASPQSMCSQFLLGVHQSR